MSAHALVYGAAELKQVAQRNWTFGFALSLLVHLCLLAAYLLTEPYEVGELKFPPRPPRIPVLRITSIEGLVGTVAPQPVAASPRINPQRGTPVPVAELNIPKTSEVSPGPGGVNEGVPPENFNGGENPR